MKPSDKQNWPAVVFFSTCGLFFFSCVWYLWAGAMNPEYYWHSSAGVTAQATDRILDRNGCVILAKNHGARVDNARVVYRGSHGGALHMDLYILQLDPHYCYPHRVEKDLARKGFHMGDYHFQVLAASDGKISLKRI